METEKLIQKSRFYLKKLCEDIPERCVGSEGNRIATRFFEKEISSFGWKTEVQEFTAIDWHDGGASLMVGILSFAVSPSPYSLDVDAQEPLITVANIEELEQADIKGKIVLLHDQIAREQIMPKNFVFYNPPEHQHIISLLEKGEPKAIVCATGRNASLAGGVYPFPLIEDGDFDIPSVYMTEEEGRRLLPWAGKTVALKSISKRIPGKGDNIIATKGAPANGRMVISAHIDAKKGTPGAIDNATGVVVLLLLAELLEKYDGKIQIEMVAFNGEDYYAVPGQMLYVSKNQDRFNEIMVNINIDGAGYKDGKTAFSFYGLPSDMESKARSVLDQFDGLTEGPQWPQGDHSLFIQFDRPAIAVTSAWFSDNIDHQEITHTPKDNPQIVDCQKLVEIGRALNRFIAIY